MGKDLSASDVDNDVAELLMFSNHVELGKGGTGMLLGGVGQDCRRRGTVHHEIVDHLGSGSRGQRGRGPRGTH